MFKATRELIKARQLHTKYVMEQVFVKQIGGGIANKCFQNATADTLLQNGNRVVSGWVVNAFDINTNSTAIVQHWWNIDSSGNYFDTTPDIHKDCEYVVDTDIAEFGQANIAQLDNLVAISLLFKNNEFFGVTMQKNNVLSTIPLQSLMVCNLFQKT